MRGTILCWVSDSPHGRAALKAAADLSDRLKLRLVLAHVADGASADESVARTRQREGAARLVARLAAEYGVVDRAEHRSAVGDAAVVIGQIAAEEAADLIVIGATKEGRCGAAREPTCGAARERTPVPVLFVPPRRARQGTLATRRRRALTSS